MMSMYMLAALKHLNQLLNFCFNYCIFKNLNQLLNWNSVLIIAT